MEQGVKRKIEKYFTKQGIVLLSKSNENECTHFFLTPSVGVCLRKKLEIILENSFH